MIRAIGYLIILALSAGVVAGALGVVFARQECRRLFVEYTELTKDRDHLKFEFGRLELERATKGEINGVEKIARGDLGMISPGVGNSVVIKR